MSEIVDISDEDRNAFFADVNRAAKAIHKTFNPDKVNYARQLRPEPQLQEKVYSRLLQDFQASSILQKMCAIYYQSIIRWKMKKNSKKRLTRK